MARAGPMDDREVWIQAGAILAKHGDGAINYIIDHICEALSNKVVVEDWRRVAAAVDAIIDADSLGYN